MQCRGPIGTGTAEQWQTSTASDGSAGRAEIRIVPLPADAPAAAGWSDSAGDPISCCICTMYKSIASLSTRASALCASQDRKQSHKKTSTCDVSRRPRRRRQPVASAQR